MATGFFKFEDDPLKHFIRTKGWLPRCLQRLRRLNHDRPAKQRRRLKYFTFCAVGAIDVLMLDLERVVRRSTSGRFDTVHFFARDPDDILETQKRIPGGIGFSGNFVSTVLLKDDDEDAILGINPLDAPTDEPDVLETRNRQRMVAMRSQLRDSFPFDILNLDLEGYLFRPNDPIPGDLIRALKKVFNWQQRPLKVGRHEEILNEFTLMFTTKIGPDNLTEEYLQMLSNAIDANIEVNADLQELLVARTGFESGTDLREDFKNLFLIGAPKLLASTLMDEDWYVDPEIGIQVYKFDRTYDEGEYSMVHLVMDIKRKNPPENKRPPGTNPQEVVQAYGNVVRQLFEQSEIEVTLETNGIDNLSPSLESIKQRRRIYYKDDEE